MVVLIALIVLSGVMLAGHIRGWFGSNSQSEMVCEDITGVVNVERSAVGYTLEKDVAIKSGDIIETKNGSEAVLSLNDRNRVAISERTELKIPSCEEDLVE